MTVWRNDRKLDLIDRSRRSETARRRFLVFLVPHPEMPSPFLASTPHQRSFDLAVRFYANPGCNEALMREADYVMTGGLSKFHAAAQFLSMTGLDAAYDGYLFLDGDVEFEADDMNRFLNLVRAAGLDLAQPSMTRDSYSYWNMTYHQPAFVFRETSFVEVMAPYLSRAALSRTLATFERSISSYGLDHVWSSLLGSKAIGVVDAIQVRHRERVDHVSGKFYQYLKSIGVDLDDEELRVLDHYGVVPEHAHSRRGYFWKTSRPASGASRKLASVPLPGIERYTNRQVLIDLAMKAARHGISRSEAEIGRAISAQVD